MSIAKWVSGILLALCLLATVSSLALYNFTNLNNLEETVPQLIVLQTGGLTQEQASQMRTDILSDCKRTGYRTANLPVSESLVISLDCGEVSATNDMLSLITASIVKTIYYADYNCRILSCIAAGQPFVLLSERVHNLYKIVAYIFAALAVAFGVLMFGWSGSVREGIGSVGEVLIIAGLAAIPLYILRKLMGTQLEFFNRLLYLLQFRFEIVLAVGLVLFIAYFLMGRLKSA